MSCLAAALVACFGAGCRMPMLSPDQRQQLETHVHAGSYDAVFASARDTAINSGFRVDGSDHSGGFFHISRSLPRYDKTTALTLSFLAPPAGDFYVDRRRAMVWDFFLWPLAMVWAPPINYLKARDTWFDVTGNMSFESLGPEETRVRVTLNGVEWDAGSYPPVIRRLHHEIERQLFLKAHATDGLRGP